MNAGTRDVRDDGATEQMLRQSSLNSSVCMHCVHMLQSIRVTAMIVWYFLVDFSGNFFFFFGCWRLSKWFWFCIFIFGFFSVCHNTHLGGFVLFSISSKFSRTRVFGANDISHVRQTRNECEQTAWQASGNISRTRRWGKKLTKIWRKTDPFASEHFYGTLSKAAEMGNRETELRLWKMTEWPERIARGRSSTIFRLSQHNFTFTSADYCVFGISIARPATPSSTFTILFIILFSVFLSLLHFTSRCRVILWSVLIYFISLFSIIDDFAYN